MILKSSSFSGRPGLSMLELVLGVLIFSLAMLPLFTLTQKTVHETYSIGKHLIGSQIGSSILDRLLSMPFEEAKKLIADVEDKPIPVFKGDGGGDNLIVNDTLITNVIDQMEAPPDGKGKTIKSELERVLRSYTYTLKKITEPSEDKDGDFMILIKVTVNWVVDETDDPKNSKTPRSLTRMAIKFKEES